MSDFFRDIFQRSGFFSDYALGLIDTDSKKVKTTPTVQPIKLVPDIEASDDAIVIENEMTSCLASENCDELPVEIEEGLAA